MKNKSKSSVSIIGGADGPTSVFLAGKSGKRSLKDRADSYFYGKKRDRVAKTIMPGAHSLEEVVSYIKERYGAAEVPETAHKYIKQKKSLKEGLIIQNRLDLLGNMAEIQPPDFYVSLFLLLEKATNTEGDVAELKRDMADIKPRICKLKKEVKVIQLLYSKLSNYTSA